jgi:hypothetical protein
VVVELTDPPLGVHDAVVNVIEDKDEEFAESV